jgi:hypothetical protein
MDYLKVRWVHDSSDDPVLLMSELDEDRYEVRKVEVFSDGRMGFASAVQSGGETQLGEKPVPPASVIAEDPRFVVQPLDAQDFERAWLAAVAGARWLP